MASTAERKSYSDGGSPTHDRRSTNALGLGDMNHPGKIMQGLPLAQKGLVQQGDSNLLVPSNSGIYHEKPDNSPLSLTMSFDTIFQTLNSHSINGQPSLQLATSHLREVLARLKREFEAKHEKLSQAEKENLERRAQALSIFISDFLRTGSDQAAVIKKYKNTIGLCSRSANYLLPKLLHFVIIAAFFLGGYFLASHIPMPDGLVNAAKETINSLLSYCHYDLITTETANAVVTGIISAPIFYYAFDRLVALFGLAGEHIKSPDSPQKASTTEKAEPKTWKDTAVSILVGGQGLYRRISNLPSGEYQVYRAAEPLKRPK